MTNFDIFAVDPNSSPLPPLRFPLSGFYILTRPPAC